MSYEQHDQVIVRRMLDEVREYRDDSRWSDIFAESEAFVGGLYDVFVPDIVPDKRGVAMRVGGTALAYVKLRYGDEGAVRTYSGTVERDAVATYHNAAHTRRVMRDMFRYAYDTNLREPGTYSDDDFARFPVVGGSHDAQMGNGRGVDERQSAAFAAALPVELGVADVPEEAAEVSVLATTWDPVRARQAVDPRRGWLPQQRVTAVADLLPFFDERGPAGSIGLAPEMFSGVAQERIFTQEARTAGFRADGASVADCMTFIDQRPVLRQAYSDYIQGCAGFCRDFQPVDPKLDSMYPGRARNIQFLGRLATLYTEGELTARGTLGVAEVYAQSRRSR